MESAFYPPPTVNNLDQTQRMRLVRSNRKLEAVLGTAPYYLEPECQEIAFDVPTSKVHRREGRVFGHSPSSSSVSSSSSTSSLLSEESYVVVDKSFKSSPLVTFPAPSTKSSKQAPRALELSRPLLLRLRSVPVPPTDTRSAALLSPRLPSVIPVSPTSPTFTIDLEKRQATSLEKRRKKMAKLTRTLGENIPPELVFPSSTPADPNATEKPTRTRNPQRKPLPESFAPPSPSPSSLTPHNGAAKPPVTISRPKQPKSRRPSVTAPPPSSTPSTQPANASTLADRRRKPRPRSLSLSTGTDMFAAAAQLQAAPEEKPTDAEDILIDRDVAPLLRKAITTTTTTTVHAAMSYNTITINEKATKDILLAGSGRSPPPFQTTIPEPTTATAPAAAYQHQYSRSSPSNIYHPAHQHFKSQSALSTSSSFGPGEAAAPSSFMQFGKRKERGWSGEWNQDMGEVVKVLRGLKAR